MKRLLMAATMLVPSLAYGQTCAPPAAASAAGYTQQTGSLADFMNTNPGGAQVANNPDGSITLAKSGGFNANWDLATAQPGGQGMSFGGGGYFEATLAIQGNITTNGGWPAFWANDIEKQANPSGAGTPGTWYEPDVMETFGNGSYGDTVHSWSGTCCALSNIGNTTPSGFSPVTWPAGFDASQPHSYGMLWNPATATSVGSMTFYLDGVQNNTVSWNYNDGSPYSQLDGRHLFLILGTGPANPMTIYNVGVWQNGAANDIGTSAGTLPRGTCPMATATGSAASTPPICLTAWPHAPSYCPDVPVQTANIPAPTIPAPASAAPRRQIRDAPTACQ